LVATLGADVALTLDVNSLVRQHGDPSVHGTLRDDNDDTSNDDFAYIVLGSDGSNITGVDQAWWCVDTRALDRALRQALAVGGEAAGSAWSGDGGSLGIATDKSNSGGASKTDVARATKQQVAASPDVGTGGDSVISEAVLDAGDNATATSGKNDVDVISEKLIEVDYPASSPAAAESAEGANGARRNNEATFEERAFPNVRALAVAPKAAAKTAEGANCAGGGSKGEGSEAATEEGTAVQEIPSGAADAPTAADSVATATALKVPAVEVSTASASSKTLLLRRTSQGRGEVASAAIESELTSNHNQHRRRRRWWRLWLF
jgi:hypothetical protein